MVQIFHKKLNEKHDYSAEIYFNSVLVDKIFSRLLTAHTFFCIDFFYFDSVTVTILLNGLKKLKND